MLEWLVLSGLRKIYSSEIVRHEDWSKKWVKKLWTIAQDHFNKEPVSLKANYKEMRGDARLLQSTASDTCLIVLDVLFFNYLFIKL